MKKIFKILLTCVFIVVLGFAGLIGYAAFSDYKPGPIIKVYEKKDAEKIPEQKNFTLLIWNIGYAGLGRDMDFFYDGGKQVRQKKTMVEDNIAAIKTFIARQKDVDFFLLQEVDQKSKRSYFIDEFSKIAKLFPGFHSSFGKNYDVFFVPVPFSDPMGSVLSGLQTLSRFEPLLVIRHSFPGNYAFPQSLFMLDRCFLVSRYRLNLKKELVVINTHNSAYDDGTLRSRQMIFLKNFLQREYEIGNYVIVGGDWNQSPPGFKPEFKFNRMDNKNRMDIKKGYLPGWKWAYDQKTPSNRRLTAPYNKKTTLTTTIDYFLVSPNIEVRQVHGIHLGFEHSDHNPVKLKIELKD